MLIFFSIASIYYNSWIILTFSHYPIVMTIKVDVLVWMIPKIHSYAITNNIFYHTHEHLVSARNPYPDYIFEWCSVCICLCKYPRLFIDKLA